MNKTTNTPLNTLSNHGRRVFGFSDFSLRTKLLTAFLAVTLIPLGIVFYLNNNQTGQLLTQDADSRLQGLAVETADHVDDFIANGLTSAKVTANLAKMSDYLELPPEERAHSEVDVNVNLHAISSLDEAYITSVGLMDLNGKNLIDTDPTQVGEIESEKRFFTEAVKTKTPYVSAVELDEGDLSLYFSAPVQNENGKVVGVLRIRYDAAILQSLLVQTAENSKMEGVVMDLFDENYIALAITDEPGEILTTVVTLSEDRVAQLQAENRLPEGSPESLSLNQPDLEQNLNNASLLPSFTLESEGEEASVAPLENAPWIVLAAQPQDIYLAPLVAANRSNVFIGLIAALLVAIAAVLVSQGISRPVTDLTNVANQIANGDITAQAKIGTRDEIGQLANSFNEMTNQLRKNELNLERRAREVTIVAEVSRRLSTILDQQKLLQEVVEQVKSSFNYYHAHIYLVDHTSGDLIMAGGTGDAGRAMLERKHKISQGRGLVGRAAETRTPVLVSDTSKDSTWLPNPLLSETVSEVAVPILSGDEVLGVLDVQHNVVDGLQQSDADLLQSIAYQVAAALKNAQTYASAQQRAEHETLIGSINRNIQNTTTIEGALQMAALELGRALGSAETRVVLDAPVEKK